MEIGHLDDHVGPCQARHLGPVVYDLQLHRSRSRQCPDYPLHRYSSDQISVVYVFVSLHIGYIEVTSCILPISSIYPPPPRPHPLSTPPHHTWHDMTWRQTQRLDVKCVTENRGACFVDGTGAVVVRELGRETNMKKTLKDFKASIASVRLCVVGTIRFGLDDSVQ